MQKNPTILKDELGLLNADRSAVIKELRRLSEELKEKRIEIDEAEYELADVVKQKESEYSVIEENRKKNLQLKDEIQENHAELVSVKTRIDSACVKNSQIEKEHLGRIKEFKDREVELQNSIDSLRKVYDKNSKVYRESVSDLKKEVRSLEKAVKKSSIVREEQVKQTEKAKEEEKKLLKDRLKREDKIRKRESYLTAFDKSLTKKEEDLLAMASDLAIIYGRLREEYEKTHPELDLEKIITNGL